MAQIQKSYNSRDRKEKVLKEGAPDEKQAQPEKEKEKKTSFKESPNDKDVINQIEDNMVK